jgi:hypothetical protein
LPTPEFRPHIRGYKRQKSSSNSFTATNKTPAIEFIGNNEGNTDKFGDLVRLIVDLKNTVLEQGNTIRSLKLDLTQIKAEQDSLKS